MTKELDVFIIGHNQENVVVHEKALRNMGANSPAYREFSMDVIRDNGQLYTLPDYYTHLTDNAEKKPFRLGNIFSATIAYLGSYLHKHNFTFDYVNSFQDNKPYIEQVLRDTNVKLVIVPTTLYVTSDPILEIVKFLRALRPDVKIAMGGPFIHRNVYALDGNSLNFFFKMLGGDYYISETQGEQALVSLVSSLANGTPIEDVKNIYYRKNGAFANNGFERENNILDQNTINWSIFKDRGVGDIVNIRTAISCPFTCSFCEYPKFEGKYQTMSVEALEKELDLLAELKSVKYLYFVDDTFNIPVKRFKEILKMMIRKQYGFQWSSFCRCQFLDEETVILMKESGCMGVYLGIESGDDDILEIMNKKTTVENYQRGIELLKKHDIAILVSTLVGIPGETIETVQNTKNFIDLVKPDYLRVHLWFCSQETELWGDREKWEIEGSQFEWKHKTMNSKQAIEYVWDLFFNTKSAVYIPQYDFDFAGVLNLLNRGMSKSQIKEFITSFNNIVKRQLTDENNSDVTEEERNKLRELCKAI